jgi:hypothetical protein
MAEDSGEILISYAWGGESEDLVNQLDEAFQAKGITIIRDKRDLGFKGRIKAFMERIGHGKAIIVVISDQYLKSENCMFELVQIAKNGQFYDRIFPVVMSDANIYKPTQRIKYVQHWEKQIEELAEAMKTVSPANLHGFREDIDLYTEIRATIAELTNLLKDMNTLTSSIHTESNFKALFEAVEYRLTESVTTAGIEQGQRKQLLDERATYKFSRNQLDQGTNKLVEQLQDTINPQLKTALAWLSDYRERANSAGRIALKQHPEVEAELIRDIRRLNRFYKELERCLYRLYFALLTYNKQPINEVDVSLNTDVYKTALDIVESRVPSDNQEVKQHFSTYIKHLKERLNAVNL